MALWHGQTPGETILTFTTSTVGDSRITIEIDVLAITEAEQRVCHYRPRYRLTAGTLWEYREVEHSDSLELLVRRANKIANANTLQEARQAIGVAP